MWLFEGQLSKRRQFQSCGKNKSPNEDGKRSKEIVTMSINKSFKKLYYDGEA